MIPMQLRMQQRPLPMMMQPKPNSLSSTGRFELAILRRELPLRTSLVVRAEDQGLILVLLGPSLAVEAEAEVGAGMEMEMDQAKGRAQSLFGGRILQRWTTGRTMASI